MKDAPGKIADNLALRVGGTVEKAAGSAPSVVGKAQDKVRAALKREAQFRGQAQLPEKKRYSECDVATLAAWSCS